MPSYHEEIFKTGCKVFFIARIYIHVVESERHQNQGNQWPFCTLRKNGSVFSNMLDSCCSDLTVNLYFEILKNLILNRCSNTVVAVKRENIL